MKRASTIRAGAGAILLITLALATSAMAAVKHTLANTASPTTGGGAGHTFTYGGHTSYVNVPLQFKLQHLGTGNTDHVTSQCGISFCGTGGVLGFIYCYDDSVAFSGGSFTHDIDPIIFYDDTSNGTSTLRATGSAFIHTHYGDGTVEKYTANDIGCSDSPSKTSSAVTYYYKLKWFDGTGIGRSAVTSAQVDLPQ
jgi:hypothetical protein